MGNCDSNSGVKFTIPSNLRNEWLFFSGSFLKTSSNTKGIISMGSCAGWFDLFTCSNNFPTSTTYKILFDRRDHFMRHITVYDYAKTQGSTSAMIKTSGCTNDNFGNSWSQWDSKTGKWYDNVDFSSYVSDIDNGNANTALDGKLTPDGYIVDGSTGQCKLSGFTRQSNGYFCYETWGDGKDYGKISS